MFSESKKLNDNNQPKWIKKYDFSKPWHERGTGSLSRRVDYECGELNLFIGGYDLTNIIIINLYLKDTDTLNKIKAECDQSKLPSIQYQIRIYTPSIISINTHSSNKDTLATFIKILDKHIHLGKKVKDEIFEALKIKKIADEKSFYTELQELVDISKFDEALNKAQTVEDDDAIWKLGQYCQSAQKLNEALKCYQNISSDNPHYQDAHEQMAHIIMQLDALNQSSSTLSLDETDTDDTDKEKLKVKLEHMFNAKASQDNQTWIDRTFHQLCGGTTFSPVVTNVQPNAATLFALAQQIEAQRQQILNLEKKLELKAEQNKGSTSTLFGETESKRPKGPGQS